MPRFYNNSAATIALRSNKLLPARSESQLTTDEALHVDVTLATAEAPAFEYSDDFNAIGSGTVSLHNRSLSSNIGIWKFENIVEADPLLIDVTDGSRLIVNDGSGEISLHIESENGENTKEVSVSFQSVDFNDVESAELTVILVNSNDEVGIRMKAHAVGAVASTSQLVYTADLVDLSSGLSVIAAIDNNSATAPLFNDMTSFTGLNFTFQYNNGTISFSSDNSEEVAATEFTNFWPLDNYADFSFDKILIIVRSAASNTMYVGGVYVTSDSTI